MLEALAHNNTNAGGGYIVHHDEQRFIRGQALLKSTERHRATSWSAAAPKRAAAADPGPGPGARSPPMTRQGAVTRDGRGEIGHRDGDDAAGRELPPVVQAPKQRLEEIQQTLPEGVRVEVIYDRADLIGRPLRTVLTEPDRRRNPGRSWSCCCCWAAFRAGLIVALAIPLSMLFATNMMGSVGITASLMSLGAIDFGLIVDSSVIMVENCMRRISLNRRGRPHLQIVQDAAIEVRQADHVRPVHHRRGLSADPGPAGDRRKTVPAHGLDRTVRVGRFAAVCPLTLMPVLASLVLPRQMKEKEIWLVRLAQMALPADCRQLRSSIRC